MHLSGYICIVFGLLCGCASPAVEEVPSVAAPTLDSVVVPAHFFGQSTSGPPLYFVEVLDSTYYQTPDQSTQALCQQYELPNTIAIVRFEKQALYGYADTVTHLTLVDEKPSKPCAYPNSQQQLIFDAKGELIHHSFAAQAQFLPHALDSLPIYVEATHNCEGLGQHALYRYQNGHLINVLNPILDHTPTTYDVRSERPLFGKKGLQPLLEDTNADGYLDFVLLGKTYAARQRRVPVRYIFAYIPAKEYYLLQD